MINVTFISTENLKDGPGNNESIHNAKYFTNRAALSCAIIHNNYDVNLTWPIISWLIALKNSTNNHNVTNYAFKMITTSWYVILESQEYYEVILLIISISIGNNICIRYINDIRQYLITILFLSKDFGMKNKGLQYISHFIYSKHNFVQILCPIIIENIFE